MTGRILLHILRAQEGSSNQSTANRKKLYQSKVEEVLDFEPKGAFIASTVKVTDYRWFMSEDL